jgi:2-dehydropantoate 2-reductase
MRIAVLGAGAIGALVAGYLKLKGEDVSLVGKPESVSAIRQHGLLISGVRGNIKVEVPSYEMLAVKPDLLILATKTQDVDKALRDNLSLLKDTLILATQNGVQAENIIAGVLPRENIISSIIMFGSTYLEPGRVTHNFEGSWILGSLFNRNDKIVPVSMVLDKAFPAVISEDILGMKYLKIFVNANNCIPAILGVSMQEAFSDTQVSRISVAIWKEGFEIISRLNIKLVSLPGFPAENITRLISIPPQEAAKVFSGIMSRLSSDPLYGSILQSIKRGRSSEIDYINGEFTSLARANNTQALLNEKLVELVHEVEKNKKFFTKEELLESVETFLN